MDIKTLTAEELLERRAAIATEVEAPEADLTALEEEVRAINAELEERKAAEAQKEEVRKAVADGAGEVMKKFNNNEERKMDKKEERAQLMDALAEYIKGNATAEQRALLTTGVSGGTVKVSNIVDDFIWTDWDK